ncbi:hypothetical protein C1701_08475 [Actinoalloteichus sp. AHMU CJ021]|uniref:SAF domain-containing protein n=1 Tax=Actinoalloteichus sp. AHMU CJ021 TaxID=2072503 RepID=UPI000CA02303|nr:hypothetical protein C1701_08475 [Actinoalloteichus sp. AHMU CJ021]
MRGGTGRGASSLSSSVWRRCRAALPPWSGPPRAVTLLRLAVAAALAVVGLVLLPGHDVPHREGRADTVTTLVAATDLAPGTPVDVSAVRGAQLPPEAVPAAALTAPDQAAGRFPLVPVQAGEVLTEARFAVAGRPGHIAVPVRPHDPAVVDLVRPGARVDLVSLDPGGAGHVLATDVTVVSVVDADGAATQGSFVVVALPETLGHQVAAATLRTQITITLR